MKPGKEALEALLAAPPEEAERIVREMDAAAVRGLFEDWPAWVREGQEPPPGEEWLVWLMQCGRGFGKTRTGAEWISQLARDHPGACFALVAANDKEARKVMIEGRSGLLAVARADEREHMVWEPSNRRLLFASGAEALVYSGANANSLRGPEHHFAWCDELAKWRQAQASWDNLMFTVRCGDHPRVLVTTTPRPIAALRAIIGGAETVRTGGTSWDNPHVSERRLRALERDYGGSRLGRQEMEGELLEDVEGTLWPRALIEACRVKGVVDRDSHFPHEGGLSIRRARESDRPFRRVVIGVDPPASAEGVCGIVACGLDEAGIGHVLADHSGGGLSPQAWALKVAAAAEAHGAQRVVAEANNGGAMVEAVLRGAALELPVKLVHAADGKSARAAPVAALFESKRARFAGRFPELEDELAGLTWGGRYEGPGRSPDRADAMVWAMTELMLGRKRGPPRIRLL